MARAAIPLHDTHDLPAVCCVCGKPATRTRTETFTWVPPWVFALAFFGVLPWVFAAALTRRTAVLTLPVCDRHRRRSRKAWVVLAVGLVLAVAAGFASDLGPAQYRTDVILGAVLFGLFAVVVAVGLADDRVRAAGIDARSVTLDRVSDGFAAALTAEPAAPPRAAVPSGGVELATARYLRGRPAPPV